MDRRTYLIAGLLGASIATPAFADQARLEAEVVNGVAPLAVMFDARKSVDSNVSDPFHELVYTFEFGEKRANSAYAKTWGLDGDAFLTRMSKDRYVGGPLAGHVYETPGTYTATVRVTDPAGGETSATLSITVRDPNTVYPGTQTICIRAGTASFVGCPAGAEQRTAASFSQAATTASQGKRVLLRRGDTFTSGGTIKPTAGGILGAFGSGARPRVTGTDPLLRVGGVGARVVDIEFVSSATMNAPLGAGVIEGSGLEDDIRQALVLRVKTTNGFGAFGLKGQGSSRHQVALVDSELGDVADRNDGKEGGKQLDGDYTKSMFLGNLLGKSVKGFNARFYGFDNGIFAFNKFNGTNVKTSLRIHAASTVPSENFIFAYNTWGANTNQTAEFKPASTSFYNVIRNYIVEGNFVATGTSTMRVFGQRVSIRNNIKRTSGSGASAALATVERLELAKCDGSQCTQYPTKDVWINNNTCYFTGTTASACVAAETDVTPGPLEASNNLLYAPNAPSTAVVKGPFAVAKNNRFSASPTPLVRAQPQLIQDYMRIASIASANIGAAIDGTFLGEIVDERPRAPVLLEVREIR